MAERSIPERLINQRRSQESLDMYDDQHYGEGIGHRTVKGPSLEVLLDICPQPPYVKDMQDIQNSNCVFMVQPFNYDPTNPDRLPKPINHRTRYADRWDEHHVRMPCSLSYTFKNRKPRWPFICQLLLRLKQKCDNLTATVEDLKRTIESCTERHYNMDCLEHLINEIYTSQQRTYFMSVALSHICSLAINVDIICSRPPPLLSAKCTRAVTMSQYQAASLLACAFFCLFPYRTEPKMKKEYENYQNPNFNTLYQRGDIKKVEKLKCILHYFKRITRTTPTGVVTIHRYALPSQNSPKWSRSTKGLAPMHLTTSKKIEDIDCALQVDFANKFIGGDVLDSGFVQEEIRFIICPEMLVSVLVCERMEANECIYLIGCERYSSYAGYARTFQYTGDFLDLKSKDYWGRKWSYLVAMDAIYFRERSVQYDMKYIKRELIKAYAGFHTNKQTPDGAFPIVTGNWGCGAFNGDRQLKAIIQLMAASEVTRPLIYAAYGDEKLIEAFHEVYDYLISQNANVADLYQYLYRYSHGRSRTSLFDYILHTPVSVLYS